MTSAAGIVSPPARDEPPGGVVAPAGGRPLDGPEAEYSRRRELFTAELSRLNRGDSRVAALRGQLFLAGLAVVAANWWWEWPRLVWLWPLAGLFLVALAWHERLHRQRVRVDRAVKFYDRGLARLADRWPGEGSDGERYRDPAHPYADDLDLFGVGSVFELLCRCGTRLGEDRLARWILNSAPPRLIHDRQSAASELAGRIDLREAAGLIAAQSGAGANQNLLMTWASTPARPLPAKVIFGVCVTAPAFWIALGFWLAKLAPLSAPLLAYAACGAWSFGLRGRIVETLRGLDRAEVGLRPLVELLRLIERERFAAPALVALQTRLAVGGLPASRRIARLQSLARGLEATLRNKFLAPLAPVLGLHVLLCEMAERWRAASGSRAGDWLEAIGEFEALVSIGTHAAERPRDPFPTFDGNGPRFEAVRLGHPLLPADRCVRNDVSLSAPVRLMVVSGSNMAGKSTLLRAIGVNAVLAYCGAPVRAESLTLSLVSLGTVIRTHDSLRGGKSLFFAALERLRTVADLADTAPPLLFLLDELLAGTNSHDRRIGAEAVLRRLLDAGAFGVVTTHDLALTEIADALAPAAVNTHFRDTLVGGTLRFDHTLRPGVVDRGNALALMRGLGLIPNSQPAPVTNRP